MSDSYLTIHEAADLLDVHWQSVRNYIDQGKIPSIKIGRSVRIPERSLAQLVNQKSPQQTELELRYKVKNLTKIENLIRKLGAKLTNHSHIIDHYYCPNYIDSMKEKDEFYDSPSGFGVRVREVDNDYMGKVVTTLEIKKLAGPDYNDHSNCIEEIIDVDSLEEVDKMLVLMNMKKFLVVDKERFVYRLDEIKFCIDNIKDWGTGLEIEIMSSNLSADRKRLEKYVKLLGLKAKDRPKNSFTYEIIRDTSRF